MTETDQPDHDQFDDDEWCDLCGEDVGAESHYHCAGCGQVVSMMGHSADVCPTPWEAR